METTLIQPVGLWPLCLLLQIAMVSFALFIATTATTWDMYDSFRSAGLGEAALSPDTDKASVPEIVSNHRLDPTRAPERTMSVISTTSIGTVTLSLIESNHIRGQRLWLWSCSSCRISYLFTVYFMMMCDINGRLSFPASASSSRIEMEPFVVPSEDEPDPELVLQSEKFQQDLFVMERIILENIYQPKLAAYRQLPTLEGMVVTDACVSTHWAQTSVQPLFFIYIWLSCQLTWIQREINTMTFEFKLRTLCKSNQISTFIQRHYISIFLYYMETMLIQPVFSQWVVFFWWLLQANSTL